MDMKEIVYLKVHESEEFTDSQNVLVSSKLAVLLDTKVDDYFSIKIKGYTTIIAKFIPYTEGALELPAKNLERYFVSTTDCVQLPVIKTPSNHIVPLEDISMLQKTPIRQITIDITVKGKKQLLKYVQNRTSFLATVKRLIGMYGVVANCTIKLKTNVVAQYVGIDSIYVRHLTLCHSCLTSSQAKAFVGFGFIDKGRKCNHKSTGEDCDVGDIVNISSIKCSDEETVECFGGMEESLEELEESVESKYVQLVSGPQGSGKRTLVLKLCHQLDMHLLHINCGELVQLKEKEAIKKFKEVCCDAVDLSSGLKVAVLLKNVYFFSEKFSFNCELREAVGLLHANGVTVFATTTYPDTNNPLHKYFDVDIINVGESTLKYRCGVLSAITDGKLTIDELNKVAVVMPSYVAQDINHIHKVALKDIVNKSSSNISSSELVSLLMSACKNYIPSIIRNCEMIGDRPHSNPVAGMDSLVSELTSIITNIVAGDFTVEKIFNTQISRGVILYGPPGCGKTQLLCNLAQNLGCTFMLVQPKFILSSYVGEMEKNLKKVFWNARNARPTIVFFDEIDGLFGDRKNSYISPARLNLLAEFLDILDGVNASELMEGLVVIGATNNPEKLDQALLREGRFSKKVYVGKPDKVQRLAILQCKLQNAELEDEEILQKVAEKTEGLTGAELGNIVLHSCMAAMIEKSMKGDKVFITSENLLKHSKTKSGVTPQMLKKYEVFQKASIVDAE